MATTLADAERMLAAARASGKIAVLGYNYIQNPIDPPDAPHPRRQADRRGQPRAHRDGRGFHGRSGGALLLEERSLVRPRRARRFRRASAEPDLKCSSAACAGSAATWRSLIPTGPSRAADGAPSRPSTSPRRSSNWRAAPRASSRSTAPPGAARVVSSVQIFGSKGTHRLRPGAHERSCSSTPPTAARERRVSGRSWRRRTTRPTTGSSRRPATGSASTT